MVSKAQGGKTMNYPRTIMIFIILLIFMSAASVAQARPAETHDKTLSPYFFVQSEDPDLDRLPLKSTSVAVEIAGVIADVTVTQVYKNEGNNPLEAVYIFPGSTRAAVYGMRMTIGERTINAKIRTREAARKEYEQARQEGKSASLLEQHRPNVFQMNVANILPSDVIKVELKYTELLVPLDTVYEFVYPTVVGPRYVDQAAGETTVSEGWTANPYLHAGELPTYSFDISVNMAAGLPIRDITCTSHRTQTDYYGPATASVNLEPSERHSGNRDFVLRYRLAGARIETGLLLHEGEDENFFLLMMQPPKRVSQDQIPPREYIFIVDVSGSMHGFPLNISKKLLKDLIGGLRPTDRFNVLLFAAGSQLLSEQSLPATRGNIRRAIHTIERQRGGGGTRLLGALKRALALPEMEGFSRTVVIATDGYVAVEEEAFDLIRDNLGRANMFAFGIGSSVNRHLIEGMARVGMGEPFVITRPEEAPLTAKRFKKLIASPVLTNIETEFDRFKVYDVEPPSIPDVLADRPVIVFGKWRGRPQGRIRVKGLSADGPFEQELDVSATGPSNTNAALRYLWARHRISLLADYNRLQPQDERVKEVTNLGLSYNLLTAYTSFVAVDNQRRLKHGKAVTVRQPLPLPEGVSDYAVGKSSLVRKALSTLAAAPALRRQMDKVEEECREIKGTGRRTPPSEPLPSTDTAKDLELRKVDVSEGLSEKAVRETLERHFSGFDRCYKSAPEREELKGNVVFKLLVDPSGRIIDVHVEGGVDKEGQFARCLIQTLKKLQLPATRSDKPITIKLTFLLK
jgi:Ca-activated chloride channel family protein